MAHSDMDENEWEESGKHDEQQDDLFTSSIDTTSSVVSKTSRGSRHKHKHRKKRSDSQASNASLKSDKSQKETKKVSKKSGNCTHIVYSIYLRECLVGCLSTKRASMNIFIKMAHVPLEICSDFSLADKYSNT